MKRNAPTDPSRPTAVERAFQLAKSGRCRSVTEVRQALSEEGYDDYQIEGKGLVGQLRAIMRPCPPTRDS